MMLRSGRIAPVLSRICQDPHIQTAMLITCDGELLGATSGTFVNSEGGKESIENMGTLVADIAMDYQAMGESMLALDQGLQQQQQPPPAQKRNNLPFLLLEMELGMVGVSSCTGIDCLVIAIATKDARPGMVKAWLTTVADHISEALSPLTEAVYR